MLQLRADMPLGPETIDHDDPIFIEDFEGDEFVYFRDRMGFSINVENQTMVLFQRINGEWFDDKIALADLRRATENAPQSEDLYFQNQMSGARGIGQSIGLAMRNSVEQSKARNGTGITLHFRSVERPTFFINITDEEERTKLMEAFRQAISDGAMRTPLRIIPDEVRKAYTQRTDEEIKQAATDEKRTELKIAQTRIGARGYMGILIFGALGVLPFYYAVRFYSYSVNGRYPTLFAFDAFVYFLICAACGWLALVMFKYLRLWVYGLDSADTKTAA